MDFIWATLKAILSILIFSLHPQILDFQIVVPKCCPFIINHTSMESLFIQLSDDVYMTGFVVQVNIF